MKKLSQTFEAVDSNGRQHLVYVYTERIQGGNSEVRGHRSLRMYGHRVHEAVLASGDRESGVSVHIVDAEYDTGPVLAQTRVLVERSDTVEALSRRVHEREVEFVVEVLGDILRGGTQLPRSEAAR